MTALPIAAGLLIAAFVLFDFLLTTVSLRRQGPLTELVSTVLGPIVRRLGPTLRAYGGPITLSALAATWITGQWIGWTLVFFGARRHLIGPDQAPEIGFGDTLGFAGSTLSTLGIGVVTPLAPWVHVLVVLASVCGMLVLTLSVTYVINVSEVATSSRSMALQLRDIAEVLEATDGQEGRRTDLVGRAADLRASLHHLADRRDSFPLAQLYEVEGAPRDVARRAGELLAHVRDALRTAPAPPDRVGLELLAGALARLTREDEAGTGAEG